VLRQPCEILDYVNRVDLTVASTNQSGDIDPACQPMKIPLVMRSVIGEMINRETTMTTTNRRTCRKNFLLAALLAMVTGIITGCGGGSGDGVATNESGTALITLTDAPGDFVTYAIDITSISLERADGTRVETLPNRARIDFAQYVHLTELFTAAQVPSGTYVGATISELATSLSI
jgi:hypothetical protein